MQAVNAGARLDRLPISRFHYRNMGLIAGGLFLDGFEIALQGVVLAALIATGWSTPAQNALFISTTFAGMMLGAWLAGIVGDRYGRRFSYQVNLLIFGLASFAGAAAPSMEWLTVARFFMGVGLGAEIVVSYVSLAELVPPASRGRWGGALATIANSSVFISALAARLVIPEFGWRPLFVLVGVGALVVWAARKAMPESPRWLESKGRAAEAEQVLATIEAEVGRTTGTVLRTPARPVPSGPARNLRLSHLFSPNLRARTMTGCILLVAINVTLYGFIAFLPSFMVQRGLTITTSLNYVMLMSLGGPVGALVGMALGDRIGRKPSLVLFSLTALVCGLIYPHAVSAAEVTGVGFLLVTSVYVLVAVAFSMYVQELFPTEIRMRGVGLCNMVGRFALIVTPNITAMLYGTGGVYSVVLWIAALLALSTAVLIVVGPETKGRSLETLNETGVISPVESLASLHGALSMADQAAAPTAPSLDEAGT